MPIERLKPENFFDEERIKAMKKIVPEAFADGKINWTTLKSALGAELEDGEKIQEHFGLFWPGKHEARRLASQPSKGTLVPAKGEGINEDTTGNIFIEGENLEVLKILRKSYSGRVKMIYIDPPYNTGNDFVYDDDFTEPLTDYLKRTGQIDGEGRPLTTNKKADGRFHSKWLSMMYPRLRLARELLRDDGVIFVSIDDNEMHELRMLMNEVFGEENYLGSICRATGQTTGQDSGGLGASFDFIIVFAKSAEFDLSGLPMTEKDLLRFENEDERGKFAFDQMRKTGSSDRREDRPNMWYMVEAPDGTKVYPIAPAGYEGRWRFAKPTYQRLLSENFILWKKTKRGEEEVWWPYVKYYLEGRTKRPSPLWTDLDGNKKASRDLREIFDGKKIFDFPKPTALIQRCIQIAPETEGQEIILDFFSGSATTAHAVLNLNHADDKNRNFIMVQMPEVCEEDSEGFKAGYKNIAEIGKERIRRVIKKLAKENKEKAADLGFKVLKLTTSHYKQWENYHGESIEKLEELFDDHVTPLVDHWRKIEDGLFTEILLLEGFPLDSRISVKADFKKNALREVTCDFHENRLVVCLDEKIHADTIAGLTLAEGDTFICLDSAIDDQSKTRLADKGLIKTI